MTATVKSTGGTLTRAVVLTLTGNATFIIAIRVDDKPANSVFRASGGLLDGSSNTIATLYENPPDAGDNVVAEYTNDTPAANTNHDDQLSTATAALGKWIHFAWTRNGTTGAENIYALFEGFNPASPSFLTTVSVGARATCPTSQITAWCDNIAGNSSVGTNMAIGHVIAAPIEMTQAQVLAQFGQRAPTATVTAGSYTYLAMTDATAPEVDAGSTASNFTKAGTFSSFASEPSEWAPASAAAIISASQHAPRAQLPAKGSVSAGFGQAAQPPVIVTAPATVSQRVDRPLLDSLVAGVVPPATPGVAYLTTAPLVAPKALPPPSDVVLAGFGQAAQPPVVVTGPSAASLPVERPLLGALFAGVVPINVPGVASLSSAPSIAPRANLPPQPKVTAGAGQAAQPPAVVTAPTTVAPRVELPPQPRSISVVPFQSKFPLAVHSSGRYLVDATGAPFRVHGDAGWEATNEASLSQWRQYLDDRASRGINSVILEAINNVQFFVGSVAPANANGDKPFLLNSSGGAWAGTNQSSDADISSTNEPYWAFLDALINEADVRNIAIFLSYQYLGFGLDGTQGWSVTFLNSANTQAVCTGYGTFLGNRYKNFKNIVWMNGGDAMPPAGSELETRVHKMALAIRAAGATQLQTAHWAPDFISTDNVTFRDVLDINNTYTNGPLGGAAGPSYGRGRVGYSHSPTMPAVMLESTYEGEHSLTEAQSRNIQWGGALSNVAGAFMGNFPTYSFLVGQGWGTTALDSTGAHQMTYLNNLLSSLPWYELVPDGLAGSATITTSGQGTFTTMVNPGDQENGGTDWIVSCVNPRGTHLVAYVPNDHSPIGAFTVNTSVMSESVRARWYDPTNGTFTSISNNLPPATSRSFTIPGTNSAGDSDWVLLLETIATQVSSVVAFPSFLSTPSLPERPQIIKGAGTVAPVATLVEQVGLLPPRQELPPRPLLASGAGQAAQPPSLSTAPLVAPFTALPPADAVLAGFGAAAQSAVLVTPALVAPSAGLPPQDSVAAGSGQAAQPPVITFAPLLPPAAGLPPRDSIAAGFGQAAQVAVVASATVAYRADLPPQDSVFAGFGQAAQPPVIVTVPLAPPFAALPPQDAILAGVVPAVVPGVAYFTAAPSQPPRAELPPQARWIIGFGQAAQAPFLAQAAPVPAPRAELPPKPSLFAGFGQPATPAPAQLITAPLDAPRAWLPPLDAILAGFGQAAQVAVVVRAPLVAPVAELAPHDSVIQGFGQAAQVATVTYATLLPPLAILPAGMPYVVAGFGQAAQNATLVQAPAVPPFASLPPSASIAAGAGQAPSLPPPIIFQGPASPPFVSLPPTPSVIKGAGQAAQPPVIVYGWSVPPWAVLPPSPSLFVGVVPPAPPVAVVVSAQIVPRAAPLPPAPFLAAGFGHAAQVAIIVAQPMLMPPRAGLPPFSSIIAGFGEVLFGPPPTRGRLRLIVEDDFSLYILDES